jgi:hypothetical protein
VQTNESDQRLKREGFFEASIWKIHGNQASVRSSVMAWRTPKERIEQN